MSKREKELRKALRHIIAKYSVDDNRELCIDRLVQVVSDVVRDAIRTTYSRERNKLPHWTTW